MLFTHFGELAFKSFGEGFKKKDVKQPWFFKIVSSFIITPNKSWEFQDPISVTI